MFNISVRFRALSIVRRSKDEKGWEIFDYLGSLFTDKAIYPENEKGNHHRQRGGALHLRAGLLPE